jgi:hypothetical protein
MARAEPSGLRLTAIDASIVKGMIARGDRHHDIAAWFGVNQGRVAEVNSGAVYADVPTAPPDILPPTGPYASGRIAHTAISALSEAQSALDRAKAIIDEALKETRRNYSPISDIIA